MHKDLESSMQSQPVTSLARGRKNHGVYSGDKEKSKEQITCMKAVPNKLFSLKPTTAIR